MLTGNDVSEFQGTIDWNTFKNNSNFAIMRAGIGTARPDAQFYRNRDEARRVGLPHGFYQFVYPMYNSAQAEADYLLSLIGGLQEGEFVCVDYEVSWSGDVVGWCKDFLDRIASQSNGHKGLMYLNQALLKQYDWSRVVNGGYALWVAAYTYDPNKNDFVTGAWKFAAMQQWTDKQNVPGINGGKSDVDGNVFFGDYNALKAYGYHKPAPTPTPTPTPTPQPHTPVYSVGATVKGNQLSPDGTLKTQLHLTAKSDDQEIANSDVEITSKVDLPAPTPTPEPSHIYTADVTVKSATVTPSGALKVNLTVTAKQDGNVVFTQDQSVTYQVQMPVPPADSSSTTLAQIRAIMTGRDWWWVKYAKVKAALGV